MRMPMPPVRRGRSSPNPLSLYMKTIWQAADIKPGMWVVYIKNIPCLDKLTDVSYLASVIYQVGYLPSVRPNERCLIALCDGMVRTPSTEAELAAYLTKEGYIPLPFKHLIRVIEYLRETRA